MPGKCPAQSLFIVIGERHDSNNSLHDIDGYIFAILATNRQ